MSFEDDVAELNEYYFFREFTYSSTRFRPVPAHEVELADSLIWVGDMLVAFQLKERSDHQSGTADEERAWFQSKVLKKGTRQVRDTLGYLSRHDSIEVINNRGDTRSLSGAALRAIHKVVAYQPGHALPPDCRQIKHHQSDTAGLIHVMAADDYVELVKTLLTPAELISYLAFREALINRWGSLTAALPERALVGHYLQGGLDEPPQPFDAQRLATLRHHIDEWDVSGLIKLFPDRITAQREPTDYYHVLTEIAQLERGELKEFKKRFLLAMEDAKAGSFARPYRIAVPRTGCGFVFIPLTAEMVPNRSSGLQNLTLAHKYDQQLPRCVGVSFAPDGDGWHLVEWCYIESPWTKDPELEEHLRLHNPFRAVTAVPRTRYSFGEDAE